MWLQARVRPHNGSSANVGIAVIAVVFSTLAGMPEAESASLDLPRSQAMRSAPDAPEFLNDVVPRSKPIPEIIGPRPEIVGGSLSQDDRVIRLLIKRNDNSSGICSGLWISKSAVLTAAHCLCDRTSRIRRAPLLTNKTSPGSGAEGDWIEATGYSIFPGYRCGSRFVSGKDLALVFTKGTGSPSAQLPASARINPVNVSFDLSTVSGRICPDYSLYSDIEPVTALARQPRQRLTVSGFGRSGDATWQIGVRRQADLQMNSTICVERGSVELGCRPFHEFILGAGPSDVGVQDSCGGDSGGPVYKKGRGNRIFPVGVVSRGVNRTGPFDQGRCGAGGIYTHIGYPNVKSWLIRNGVNPSGTPICQ